MYWCFSCMFICALLVSPMFIGQKRVLHLLDLELQMFVSHQTGARKPNLGLLEEQPGSEPLSHPDFFFVNTVLSFPASVVNCNRGNQFTNCQVRAVCWLILINLTNLDTTQKRKTWVGIGSIGWAMFVGHFLNSQLRLEDRAYSRLHLS